MSRNVLFEQITSPGIFVAGIAVRTTNQDNRAQADIGNLWAKFMSENIAGQIAARLSDDIYCVYTDYENDHTGWYTAVLGCRIENPDDSDGMFTALIPKGSYRLYKPQGEIPVCVVSTWQQIWNDCCGRNYIADYDLYRGDKAEIYVGVI
ncbi:MAG TPA: effector binding domain-containing protein [Mucilaginibacter sp.]|nr:effector binding domain-containing protein [Mucilaginibacter sp.]